MKKVSELSFEEMAGLHKEMWLWLSEHPDAEKKDWPGWINIEREEMRHYCFACHVEVKASRKLLLLAGTGAFCPIMNKNLCFMIIGKCLNGLYNKWLWASPELRRDIAKQIAEIPWVDKEKEYEQTKH